MRSQWFRRINFHGKKKLISTEVEIVKMKKCFQKEMKEKLVNELNSNFVKKMKEKNFKNLWKMWIKKWKRKCERKRSMIQRNTKENLKKS